MIQAQVNKAHSFLEQQQRIRAAYRSLENGTSRHESANKEADRQNKISTETRSLSLNPTWNDPHHPHSQRTSMNYSNSTPSLTCTSPTHPISNFDSRTFIPVSTTTASSHGLSSSHSSTSLSSISSNGSYTTASTTSSSQSRKYGDSTSATPYVNPALINPPQQTSTFYQPQSNVWTAVNHRWTQHGSK